MPIEPGLLSPAMLLFSRPIRCIMPTISRAPIKFDYNDNHCDTLVQRQVKAGKNNDTVRNSVSVRVGSTEVVH